MIGSTGLPGRPDPREQLRSEVARLLCERTNLAYEHPDVVQAYKARADEVLATVFDPANRDALVAALIDVGVLRQPTDGFAKDGTAAFLADGDQWLEWIMPDDAAEDPDYYVPLYRVARGST